MIPIRDNTIQKYVPYLTWTLIALNVIIYLWDRHGRITLYGGGFVFADLGMRPNEVVEAISGGIDRDPFPIVTIFTSMFLHGNLLHLIGNMVFLLVFGVGVESALGPYRFALYYLFWGIVAAATHIYVDPNSLIPTVGASGAIGGVLGAYLLLFPANKIELYFPLFLMTTTVSAWVMLGAWFLWQIFIPQAGVANWAHAGGFLAGMATVMIMGGRAKVLEGREQEIDYDFD